VTEPQFNFWPCQETMDEAVFEEYGFASYLRSTGPELCARQSSTPRSPCCLVVDAGFSFTHVVPFYFGQRIDAGVRRIDVGGKALTNQLKEVGGSGHPTHPTRTLLLASFIWRVIVPPNDAVVHLRHWVLDWGWVWVWVWGWVWGCGGGSRQVISYRHLDVLEETFVIDQLKEDISFVAADFRKNLVEYGDLLPLTRCPSIVWLLTHISTSLCFPACLPTADLLRNHKKIPTLWNMYCQTSLS